MNRKILSFFFMFSATMLLAQTQRQLENLAVFNRLFGYVRYFHPSDEASAIDWNRFAIYGCAEVMKCENDGDLEKTLQRLFSPVAPAVKISLNKNVQFNLSEITPQDVTAFKTITWQHLGLGSENKQNVYKSVRLNRMSDQNENGLGTIVQSIKIGDYRNKPFSLKAYVKVVQGPGTGHLWARVDRESEAVGFFDDMSDRPITTDAWEEYEVRGTIDSDGSMLFFGCFLQGNGKLVVDKVELSIDENGEWKKIYTNTFEESKPNQFPEGMGQGNPPGYSIFVTDHDAKDGKHATIITTLSDDLNAGAIFEKYCKVGEHIKKEIGNGLTAIVPLALYGNTRGTYPVGDTAKLSSLKNELRNLFTIPGITAEYLPVRLGDVVITWNVFKHFYPYFDVANTNWETDFVDAVKKAFQDKSEVDFLETLQKFTAQLKDGHIWVNLSGTQAYAPPIEWEWIENKLVVTNVLEDSIPLHKGDVVTMIDGKTAEKYFDDARELISAATPGWLEYRVKTTSLVGNKQSPLKLNVISQNQVARDVALNRSLELREYYNKIRSSSTKSIDELQPGIYYMDVSKATMQEISDRIIDFENAKSIICDLRGYPNSNHGWISYLLNEKDTSTRWMRVPEIIYPDQENIVGYEDFGWEIEPNKPHINAKIFYLIDGRAISYAESYMSFIKHYRLATIIGQPTAGTNGNVNRLGLPGGYNISWTGMRVYKHDGSLLHGEGITPDVYVSKTIKGVQEGRDEFLDKALKLATEK